MNSAVAQKIADILLDKEILTFSFNPPYVYSTGLKSPFYIDNRLLISYPFERTFIVNELVKLIKSKKELKNIDYISSTLSFAAPFGVLIAEHLNLPLVLVRGEPRIHGKKNKLEGRLSKRAKVLVVEDHISTGAALIENVKTIRENGGTVEFAIAITDNEVNLSKKNLTESKVKVFALASGLSIIDEAIKRGLLKGKEKDEVLEWFKDPIRWGVERGYYPKFE